MNENNKRSSTEQSDILIYRKLRYLYGDPDRLERTERYSAEAERNRGRQCAGE